MKNPVSNHDPQGGKWRWCRLLVGMVSGLAVPLCGIPGLSQTPVWAAATEADGLTVTSDRMELDDKRQLAVFLGDVHAEEKRIQLTADKMTVYYHKSVRHPTVQKTATQGMINRSGVAKIWAEGHVVLVQDENRGTAEEMIYLVDKQTLDMLGTTENATIHQGPDRLEGKRILLTIADDHTISRISVQSGDQKRASARIIPTEGTDNKPSTHAPPRAAQKPDSAAGRQGNGP
ncbi:MAG: hypothetical protein HQL87_12380 [Magnetococcales bacterium]|nr:hypothetical protein [Magnetococcales bacterium]